MKQLRVAMRSAQDTSGFGLPDGSPVGNVKKIMRYARIFDR